MILSKDIRTNFIRRGGHFYVRGLIVCEGSTDDDYTQFMYDTGAYITVLSRNAYEKFNFDGLDKTEVSMSGYARGKAEGYIYKIPGLKIGKRLLTGVWAFTPKSYDYEENILGGNVIEYFKSFQDNESDCFYFFDNPSPKPYYSEKFDFSLACDDVFIINESPQNICQKEESRGWKATESNIFQ